MERVGGIIRFSIDGVQYRAKGNFSYMIGNPKREAVVGSDGVHGYKETPQALFIEGTIAKWMYWWLHKHHQIAVNGVFHTWLSTWAETFNWARNPRIKLH